MNGQRRITDQVLFVLIDTEGTNERFVMGLERMENRNDFRVFNTNSEVLGSRDNRHLRDKWGQLETAQYLESIGYKLFLVGADDTDHKTFVNSIPLQRTKDLVRAYKATLSSTSGVCALRFERLYIGRRRGLLIRRVANHKNDNV